MTSASLLKAAKKELKANLSGCVLGKADLNPSSIIDLLVNILKNKFATYGGRVTYINYYNIGASAIKDY